MKVAAIAINTWRETIRDRLMLAVLAIMLAGALGAIAVEGPGEGAIAAIDLGLTLMGALGTVVAIFLGTSLVHKEMDRRTLYIVLSKPITRFQFLFGKYLGLMGALTVMVGAMGLIMAVVMAGLGHFDWRLSGLVAATWMQLSLVTAIAFCFATVTSGVLATVYTAGLVLVGSQTHVIREFANSEVMLNLANFIGGQLLYCILPNFGVFDYKNALIYGGHLPWEVWGFGLAYGALLSAAFLVMAGVAWDARELP